MWLKDKLAFTLESYSDSELYICLTGTWKQNPKAQPNLKWDLILRGISIKVVALLDIDLKRMVRVSERQASVWLGSVIFETVSYSSLLAEYLQLIYLT